MRLKAAALLAAVGVADGCGTPEVDELRAAAAGLP
jgi:hypothetical protein